MVPRNRLAYTYIVHVGFLAFQVLVLRHASAEMDVVYRQDVALRPLAYHERLHEHTVVVLVFPIVILQADLWEFPPYALLRAERP
jgi:hypothetical protein